MTDVVIPNENNILTEEGWKLSKNKDLDVKISQMCGDKTVMVWAFGTIIKGFDKNLEEYIIVF